MILEDLEYYKEKLDIVYDFVEKERKLGVADKFLLKNRFDSLICSEARCRLHESEEDKTTTYSAAESEENKTWAYNVATSWVGIGKYYSEQRKTLLKLFQNRNPF